MTPILPPPITYPPLRPLSMYEQTGAGTPICEQCKRLHASSVWVRNVECPVGHQHLMCDWCWNAKVLAKEAEGDKLFACPTIVGVMEELENPRLPAASAFFCCGVTLYQQVPGSTVMCPKCGRRHRFGVG